MEDFGMYGWQCISVKLYFVIFIFRKWSWTQLTSIYKKQNTQRHKHKPFNKHKQRHKPCRLRTHDRYVTWCELQDVWLKSGSNKINLDAVTATTSGLTVLFSLCTSITWFRFRWQKTLITAISIQECIPSGV